MDDKILATNRKAFHEYHILESLEAGIQLKGTEVKSLRDGRASLNDSFARVEGNEIFLHNMHVSPYEFGNIANVEETRPRKLLLHKKQIERFIVELQSKGCTLIPLKLYLKKGLVKVEVGLAKGKKQYDKRDAIRKRESDRELKRALKAHK